MQRITSNFDLAAERIRLDIPQDEIRQGRLRKDFFYRICVIEIDAPPLRERQDDLPLLIEAAADRPLSEVFWSTAINLGEEAKQGLPELEDPRYAVFQPVLKPVGSANRLVACHLR